MEGNREIISLQIDPSRFWTWRLSLSDVLIPFIMRCLADFDM